MAHYVPGGTVKQLWNELESRLGIEEEAPHPLPPLQVILGRQLLSMKGRVPYDYSFDLEYKRRQNLGIHVVTRKHEVYETRIKDLRAARLLKPDEDCYKQIYAHLSGKGVSNCLHVNKI